MTWVVRRRLYVVAIVVGLLFIAWLMRDAVYVTVMNWR